MNWPAVLGCPRCIETWVVSVEDADATQTDLLHHIESRHANHDRVLGLRLLAQAREMTAAQAAWMWRWSIPQRHWVQIVRIREPFATVIHPDGSIRSVALGTLTTEVNE